ncbi:MAG: DNA cytosine methyltransferase, partial [Chloroflexota bacterium]
LQRIFTPVEHARLKTIPEGLVKGLSDTIAHEILGQSIVHCAFMAVGERLGKTLVDMIRPMAVVPVAA